MLSAAAIRLEVVRAEDSNPHVSYPEIDWRATPTKSARVDINMALASRASLRRSPLNPGVPGLHSTSSLRSSSSVGDSGSGTSVRSVGWGFPNSSGSEGRGTIEGKRASRSMPKPWAFTSRWEDNSSEVGALRRRDWASHAPRPQTAGDHPLGPTSPPGTALAEEGRGCPETATRGGFPARIAGERWSGRCRGSALFAMDLGAGRIGHRCDVHCVSPHQGRKAAIEHRAPNVTAQVTVHASWVVIDSQMPLARGYASRTSRSKARSSPGGAQSSKYRRCSSSPTR